MQKSPEAEPIMTPFPTPLCKGGSKTPAFDPQSPRYFAKGSVESTHKVPTSHYHTKHCHAAVVPLGYFAKGSVESSHKKGGAVRAARARARVVRDAASRQTNRSRHRRLVGALTQARRARCCEWSRCCGWGGVPHASTAR